jgi:hypothetical protein
MSMIGSVTSPLAAGIKEGTTALPAKAADCIKNRRRER